MRKLITPSGLGSLTGSPTGSPPIDSRKVETAPERPASQIHHGDRQGCGRPLASGALIASRIIIAHPGRRSRRAPQCLAPVQFFVAVQDERAVGAVGRARSASGTARRLGLARSGAHLAELLGARARASISGKAGFN